MADRSRRGLLPRLADALGRRLLASQTEQLKTLSREINELRSDTRELAKRVEFLGLSRKRLDKVLSNQKIDEKFRQILRKQMASLIRAQYLPTDIPAPLALQARRFRLRSQNEEDGIVLALLSTVGVGSRRFVEIGSGGTGGNSAVLAHDMGWSGLMVDASAGAFKAATREYRAYPGVTIVRQFVTAANVNALLHTHGFTGDVDLLSIDVDGIDYWIFSALEACQARVVVLEYNAHFGPTRSVTVPDEIPSTPAPAEYWGASLAALHKRALSKGYRLVLCEESGVNAFFVRNGLAPDLQGLTPDRAYRPFRHRLREGETSTEPARVFEQIEQAHLPLVEV